MNWLTRFATEHARREATRLQKKVDELTAELEAERRVHSVDKVEIESLAAVIARNTARIQSESAAAAAVDADESIIASQASAFSRGLNPQFALTAGSLPGQEHKPHLTTNQRKQLVNTIKRLYSGVSRHGEPLILDAVITGIERLSDRPSEMDWMDSGKMTKARILQAFGTNPIVLGEIEGANRASAVAAEQHFCEFTINPKLELIGQCLTEHLAPMFAADGERLVVWIEKCVPRDAELRIKKWEAGARFGVVTENEFRSEVLGLPEIDGGDIRIGVADSFAETISNQVGTALAQRGDIFSRNGNGKTKLLTR